ncbi:MAG: peptidoglycan DD-metalloendopeptidase family protein [Bacteroidota bacterium]
MRILSRILIFILFIVSAIPAIAQRTNKEIKQRENELQKLRNDIQAYEKKLNESEKKEKVTLDRLDDLEHNSILIRQLVQKLREEEVGMTIEIDTAKNAIANLEGQLQFLKSHYANYVRSVYKNGRVYDVELLFSSKSINQLSIRIQYLKKFSEQRAKDLQGISENKTILEQKNQQLEMKLQSERQLLSEKTREEGNLKRTFSQRQIVLKKIRKNKQTYQKELTRKTEAFKKIENLIAELIEKERIQKEREDAERRERLAAEARERELNKTATPPTPQPIDTKATSAFEKRRGKLRWPVARGTVQTPFGNQTHPVLKTITQNTGIDIATPSGSDVYAVADGEVAVLSFIPGFGNVLILNHSNGFRTVYAHLSDVMVSESQRVTEGTIIAKSGDTVAGAILHFEIWKEREKQNPEWWLANRR